MTTHNDDGSIIEDVVLSQESGNYGVDMSSFLNGAKKNLTEARLYINDQTEPQHPQHLQLLLSQMDL